MARLFPSIQTTRTDDAGPRVIGLASDDADSLLAAVSSQTARELLTALHESPATPSELSKTVDSSLQNVQYHLSRLEEASVIEVIDTVYSEKGREMNVYAPTDNPLVVVAGADEHTSILKSVLTSLLGALGIIGVLAIGVQLLFDQYLGTPSTAQDSGSRGASIMATAEATPDPTTIVPPGVLFFIGGAAALTIVLIGWYIQRRW